MDVVPVGPMLGVARELVPDRARSLALRFNNEALLLERALEKPTFGWGGFGRNLYS